MTEQEIKDNAPQDATHYDYLEKEYMRYDGGGDWKVWLDNDWTKSIVDIDYLIENFKPL